MVTLKPNFSFMAQSRNELQAMESMRTIRAGTSIAPTNGIQLKFLWRIRVPQFLASLKPWWHRTGTSLRVLLQRAAAQPWRWWDREALETQCQSTRWRGHHLPVGCHWTASSSSPAGPGFSPSTAVTGWAPPGEQRWSRDRRQCATSPRHRWPRCTWPATSEGSPPYSWEGKKKKKTV